MSKAKQKVKHPRHSVEKAEVIRPNSTYREMVDEKGGALQVADALKLDPKTVLRRCAGSTPITREMFFALAQVLGKTEYTAPV